MADSLTVTNQSQAWGSGDTNYWQPYQPYTPPQTYYWSYPIYYPDADFARYKFALELIADGKLTKEAVEKIAKAALRKDAE